ncbi:hypothetical protein [Trinickia mobilis]|uniref:hypothetical protein n=1 Tax=Trinickia mobilis TaxID=2816356 RepID=UPI001A90797A|nr:hypothetical protein [Trinickia mobilis]
MNHQIGEMAEARALLAEIFKLREGPRDLDQLRAELAKCEKLDDLFRSMHRLYGHPEILQHSVSLFQHMEDLRGKIEHAEYVESLKEEEGNAD